MSLLFFKSFRTLNVKLVLEPAPSPLHPGARGGPCALDRHLNALLEAAGQVQVLREEKMHISVDLQCMMEAWKRQTSCLKQFLKA